MGEEKRPLDAPRSRFHAPGSVFHPSGSTSLLPRHDCRSSKPLALHQRMLRGFGMSAARRSVPVRAFSHLCHLIDAYMRYRDLVPEDRFVRDGSNGFTHEFHHIVFEDRRPFSFAMKFGI